MLYWTQGLKTGMYYLRTKPAANAIQFTVDKTRLRANQPRATPLISPAGAPPAPASVTKGSLLVEGQQVNLGACAIHTENEENMDPKKKEFEAARLVCSLLNGPEGCSMCQG